MNQIAPDASTLARVSIQASQLASADECERDGPYTLPLSLSPNLRATLTTLGMREDAFSAWETFHVSPPHAMLYLFGSMATMLGAMFYIHVFGIPFKRYYFTIPCITGTTLGSCYFVSIWRTGLLAARNRLYVYSLPVSWTCSFSYFAVCFLGPLADVPFGSWTHFIAGAAVCFFSGNLANKSGVLLSGVPD